MPLPTVVTERLTLRPYRISDGPALQTLAGEFAIADTTLNIPHPYPAGAAEAWIAGREPAFDAGESVTLAVTEHDAVVGAISLRLEASQQRAELGYWIGVPYWGKGFASEAARAMIDHAFGELQLHRVYAHHLVRNPASGRVMEKIGMTREGVIREHVWRNGRVESLALYGVLRREWRAT